MSVKEIGEMYRCNVCGNEVSVTKVGGGILVCCGQEMEKFKSGKFEEMTHNMPDADGG